MKWRVVLFTLVLYPTSGCSDGPPTYSVSGKVVFDKGDIKKLAGSNVEFQTETEPKHIFYGPIQEDGSFSMGTISNGKKLNGVFAGTYKARIHLFSEDDEETAIRKSPIHLKFLDYQSSGLTFKVPGDNNISIQVSKK